MAKCNGNKCTTCGGIRAYLAVLAIAVIMGLFVGAAVLLKYGYLDKMERDTAKRMQQTEIINRQ